MTALVYLAAITTANLIVAELGPAATVPVAFAFIGLDLTLRDRLHSRWEYEGWVRGRGWLLPLRMGLLIAASGLVSWWALPTAGPIALASSVAWTLASLTDAVVYHLLRRRRWWQRVNGSNIAGAAVDSLVFPTMAFGALLPLVVLGQFVAKVAGGALWALVLGARPRRYVVGERGPERYVPPPAPE